MDVDKSEYNEVILETSASIELAPKFDKKEVKLLEELRADHVKQTTQHKFIVSVRENFKLLLFVKFCQKF